MAEIDSGALLDQLEKENKILEEELEIIMRQNVCSVNPQKLNLGNTKEIKEMQDDESFSYSQSGGRHHFDEYYEKSSNSRGRNQDNFEQNNEGSGYYEEGDGDGEEDNDLQKDENNRILNNLFQKSIREAKSSKDMQAILSPKSSLKKTNILENKFVHFDSCEDIGGEYTQVDKDKASSTKQKSEKITSLEMRLSGTQKAVKELEKQLRAKDLLLKETNFELLKKSKELERVQSLAQQPQMGQKSAQLQGSIGDYLKREKAFEKQVKEQEGVIQDLKKSGQRQSEINQSLVQRVKELERELEQQKSISKEIEPNLNIELKKKIKYLENCLHEREQQLDIVQKKHEQLIELTVEHVYHSKNLSDSLAVMEHTLN